MDQQWIVSAWVLLASAAALLVLAVWPVVALARSRARTTAALAQARSDADALKAQVEEIERRLEGPVPAPDEHEYVITRLGDVPERPRPESDPAPPIAGPLFADLVLRESVVQAASLAAGLRRALAPQVRNRIRFEMRREVKRARKQRKADLRVARREWEARQRPQMDVDDLADGSAA